MEFLDTIKSLTSNDIYIIATGIIMGTIARLVTLKVDFRQIPSYPSGFFNNIVFGFIASALGAIAIPAILAKDFTAVTFLSLALTQFREIRTAERESLEQLEHSEYAKRGDAYIDGIAKTFESRNYISLVTSVFTVLVIKLIELQNFILSIIVGVITGFIVMFFCYRFTKGKNIGLICRVKLGKIDVRESELYVDNMFVTNYLGTDRSRALFLNEGIAIVLEPKDPMSRVTLENHGQRQAVLYEATRTLGVKRYKFMRRDFNSGKVIIAFIPIVNDADKLIKAVSSTPILENSRKIKRIMKTSFGGNNE